MDRYYLLLMVFAALVFSRIFATQIQGGLRFSGNENLIVKKNSIFRKVLLRKRNRDYPLEVYKVIPFAISVILFGLVLLLYIVYIILYTFPIGIAIGTFLNSIWSGLMGFVWTILVMIYIGIINAI